MISFKNINSQHADLIHDVQYDFYGRRIATCSSDQLIKVWEMTDDQEWHCVAKLQGHVGSVWRVTWAHPEFGQVIASCGFDRTIVIWEEINDCQNESGRKLRWVKRAQLVDPRTSVTDIKFSPKHMGLVLASCSTDGMIRFYEAQDIMDLSQWTLQYDFQTYITASCMSISTCGTENPILAVGNCRPHSGNSPSIILYEFGTQKAWERIDAFTNISESVHDIAFAPNLGESYNSLAVAADQLYVFYIKKIDRSGEIGDGDRPSSYRVEMATGLSGITSPIWRVSWNATGTTLSCSGEDGVIRLWTRNHLLYWQQIGVIQSECLTFSLPTKEGQRTTGLAEDYNSTPNQTNFMEMDNPSDTDQLSSNKEFLWQN